MIRHGTFGYLICWWALVKHCRPYSSLCIVHQVAYVCCEQICLRIFEYAYFSPHHLGRLHYRTLNYILRLQRFNWPHFHLTLAVLGISANIPINHIMPKTTESVGNISVADSLNLAFISLAQIRLLTPKSTALDEMTQNSGHYAVQGHSRHSSFSSS